MLRPRPLYERPGKYSLPRTTGSALTCGVVCTRMALLGLRASPSLPVSTPAVCMWGPLVAIISLDGKRARPTLLRFTTMGSRPSKGSGRHTHSQAFLSLRLCCVRLTFPGGRFAGLPKQHDDGRSHGTFLVGLGPAGARPSPLHLSPKVTQCPWAGQWPEMASSSNSWPCLLLSQVRCGPSDS